MQEEVTQRTVALCVEATKLSAGMLQQAMKKVLDEMQKGVTGHKTKLHHGKQTLRQLMPGILLRLPTLWIAGVNTWGIRLISKPAKNPTRAKRPCTTQKANGRFLRIPTKPSGRRRLPMQQGSQGSRGAALQRWEKWECFLA